MLTKTDKARINRELKGLIDEYQRSYETIRQASEAKYKTTLQPGAVFHPHNGFYYDEDRQAFSTVCNKLKDKAHDLIDKAALEVMEQNTTAPSTEATNIVMLINSRKEVSADEIDQLMTRYGKDCPMVYKALYEKAESLGYHDFKPHPVAQEAEHMEAITGLIDKTFNVSRAEQANMVSTAAAFNLTTDMAFPAEE